MRVLCDSLNDLASVVFWWSQHLSSVEIDRAPEEALRKAFSARTCDLDRMTVVFGRFLERGGSVKDVRRRIVGLASTASATQSLELIAP
jgi:hypothetical protein